jgi:hypothetical protein
MKPLPIAAVLLTTIVACGSTKKDQQDGGDSGGNAGGTAPSGIDPCAGATRMLGSRYDEANGCVDATEQVETGCSGEPLKSGYFCVERIADGIQFWVVSIDALLVDESQWAFCSDGTTLPPPPCFAAACPVAPVSLCTQAQTEQAYDCGSPMSEWDEACCKRRLCQSAAECLIGETCVALPTRVYWDCWPTPGGTCDCGGTMGGPDRMMCVSM